MPTIIGYSYDADVHCVDCAVEEFGLEEGKDWVREDATDSEGNQVHPLFSTDEPDDSGWYCGDCDQQL